MFLGGGEGGFEYVQAAYEHRGEKLEFRLLVQVEG